MSRRQSIRPVDSDLLHLPETERRKSILTTGTGRRSSSIHSGPIASVLANKKFLNKKTGRLDTASRNIVYEPTYRLEPSVNFNEPAVRVIIQEVLQDLLQGLEYDPTSTSLMCKSIGEEVKDRVKQLGYDRYKIIVYVVIGEKKNQGVMVTSRCSWDVKFDNFAESFYQNKSLFCSTQVYGLYLD